MEFSLSDVSGHPDIYVSTFTPSYQPQTNWLAGPPVPAGRDRNVARFPVRLTNNSGEDLSFQVEDPSQVVAVSHAGPPIPTLKDALLYMILDARDNVVRSASLTVGFPGLMTAEGRVLFIKGASLIVPNRYVWLDKTMLPNGMPYTVILRLNEAFGFTAQLDLPVRFGSNAVTIEV